MRLDHGAHGAVEQKNALVEQAFQQRRPVLHRLRLSRYALVVHVGFPSAGSGGLVPRRTQAEAPADRISQVRAIEGLEMEAVDALGAPPLALFAGDRAGDELAGAGRGVGAAE